MVVGLGWLEGRGGSVAGWAEEVRGGLDEGKGYQCGRMGWKRGGMVVGWGRLEEARGGSGVGQVGRGKGW